ncbi:MAG: S-layer homology domain-containing protein [Caldisericaceae bacterium]
MLVFTKVLTIWLVFVMLFLNFFGGVKVFGLDTPIFKDNTASKWAVSELTQAYNYGLTYPDIMGKFQQPITREEFCVIVVKLYTKLTNKTVTAGASLFSDTVNPEIIKAYQLGIVKGTGGGKFSPTLPIVRQEITTMIYRALSKSYKNLPKVKPNDFPFKDANKIAPWALESMKFCFQNNIIKGVSKDKIDPLSNTTREQGIILVKRTYENFRTSINATLRLTPPPSPMSEEDKFKNLDFKALLNAPLYKTKLTLYAATGAEKPLSKPTDKTQPASGSIYTKADYGAFIEASSNKKRYFYADYGTLSPHAIVWQVSKARFVGFVDNWKNPPGLVATGTISPATKEFVIDFSKFTPLSLSGPLLNVRKTPSQQTYYVRAVPVDKNMNCIGDPGEGIRVLYGDKFIGSPKLIQATINGRKVFIPSSFEIWTTQRLGDITHYGEFPNVLMHLKEVGFNAESVAEEVRWFQFKNFPSNTKSITLQISAKPFDSKDPVNNPVGLVYSKTYTLPIPKAPSGDQNAVAVKFHDFAPSDSTLKPGDLIPYYVRAVAFVPSTSVGSENYSVSEVIKVNYEKQNPIIWYTSKTVSVPLYIPSVKITHYEPIQWQHPDWAHYYVVYRYPHWYELNFKVTNGTDTLYPYMHYYMNDPSMTPERYEKEILWKWLEPGSKIQIWDREEDKSFWGELWDGIVSFFKSLVDVIAKITNWVSQAYANLKAYLVNFVAKNFPLLPDSLRDELKKALTALVDYGLASLGIPPELPNFDQLTEAGLDYLAMEALTEAGIPANEMTTDIVKKTAKGIGESLANSTNSSTPNPLNCPFLKADPQYLYRPAYLDITITNNYDKPSRPGKLNIDVRWEWHEDGVNPYFSHFLYGLKKGYNGGYPLYYPVFEPMRDIPIPALQPHQSTKVRVYLKEYVGKPYPFAPLGESVTWEDFSLLYWGTVGGTTGAGKSHFEVYTSGFSLPKLPETHYDPNTHTTTSYAYDRINSVDVFDGIPKDPH